MKNCTDYEVDGVYARGRPETGTVHQPEGSLVQNCPMLSTFKVINWLK